MLENENANIKTPKIDYVTIEIRRTKIDDLGNIYEVIE